MDYAIGYFEMLTDEMSVKEDISMLKIEHLIKTYPNGKELLMIYPYRYRRGISMDLSVQMEPGKPLR